MTGIWPLWIVAFARPAIYGMIPIYYTHCAPNKAMTLKTFSAIKCRKKTLAILPVYIKHDQRICNTYLLLLFEFAESSIWHPQKQRPLRSKSSYKCRVKGLYLILLFRFGESGIWQKGCHGFISLLFRLVITFAWILNMIRNDTNLKKRKLFWSF